MPRNRRLRKKVHRIHLKTVLIEVSLDPVWRARIADSRPKEIFVVHRGPNAHAQRLFNRWDLSFAVCLIDEVEPGFCNWFFCALEFPEVCDVCTVFDSAALGLNRKPRRVDSVRPSGPR